MVRRLNNFVVAAVAVLIAVLLTLLAVNNTALRVMVALPLVLVLPGYAITTVLWSRRMLGGIERLLFSVGLSICVVILSGLVLNLTSWGLQANSWAVMLGSITVGASAGGWLRWRKDVVVPLVPLGLGGNLRAGLMLAVATVGMITAVGMARFPTPQQGLQGYTALWMLPVDDRNQHAVRVGIQSMEFSATAYRLDLEVNNQVVQQWTSIELRTGEKWEGVVELPEEQLNAKEVEAVLYRVGNPSFVYRQVTLKRDS